MGHIKNLSLLNKVRVRNGIGDMHLRMSLFESK